MEGDRDSESCVLCGLLAAGSHRATIGLNFRLLTLTGLRAQQVA